ncbi:zinc ribbon domain-containing protein [Papillibacter cinnamivorans]|uniref:Zinc-ribbon domain-containing protein n=1 Tax=Papillibacter cinnamivorans DSM 12816 TaxID=1122930 RepID=A0A1W2ABY7_9FIRM|nr:zinc ribbon domain-containing protein [Papillibacter cinnamivorans]SMC57768.1 zinc-ribbon domain-containing protein [Papillibacter cinnamivorans DSM 12816]
MAFLDNFGKKMSQVAQTAMEKSKDLAENAKLNLAIAAEEREIEKAYKQMGEWYFNNYGDNCDPSQAETTAKIKASLAKIEELRAQLDAEDGTPAAEKTGKTCPTCGEKVEEDSKFCPACGAQLQK